MCDKTKKKISMIKITFHNIMHKCTQTHSSYKQKIKKNQNWKFYKRALCVRLDLQTSY